MNWHVKYVFSCLFKSFSLPFCQFFMFIPPKFYGMLFSLFVKVGSLQTFPWPTKFPVWTYSAITIKVLYIFF